MFNFISFKFILKTRKIFLFLLFSLCIGVISISTGFLYDEASFLTQYYLFYIFNGHIFYFWPFGLYNYIITMSAFLINIPFGYFGFDSAIVQEFTVKIPFLFSMYMASVGIYLVMIFNKVEKRMAIEVLWIFLLTPIVLYDAAFHGNGLITTIFFEVFSIVFLYREKYMVSSIFLGIAAASYLFPIFLIIPMLYFIKRKLNGRKAVLYFTVFLSIFLIGQGTPILVYLFYGIPLSQGSVLGGIIGITSKGLVSSNASVVSPWGPYFLIYKFNGYLIDLFLAGIIFVLVMAIPGFIFVISTRDPSIENIIEMFFLESLIFVIFGLNSAPQYLTAIAPFSIILFALKRDYNHLFIITLLTILDLGSFITSSTTVIAGFLIILNPYLNAYYLKSPPALSNTLYSLYILLLFIYIVYFMYTKYSITKNLDVRKYKYHLSIDEVKRKRTNTLSYLLVFTLLLVVLLAPGIKTPPPVIPTVGNLMEESFIADKYSNNTSLSKLSTSYYISMGEPWTSFDKYAKSNGTYILNLPKSSSKQSYMGDFGQTSLIKSSINATYTERYYFPYLSVFHAYFVVFGTNITPIVNLEGNNENQNINLTNSTQKVETTSNTHQFFEITDQTIVEAGWHSLEIEIPEKNVYLSTTNFSANGVSFRTFSSGKIVYVNASDISSLYVNSTKLTNITLSLYISISSSVSINFNGKVIGNYSASSINNIIIPERMIRGTNNLTILGDYNTSNNIVLYFNPPLSLSPVVLKENIANIVFGILFLVISTSSLFFLFLFIRNILREV